MKTIPIVIALFFFVQMSAIAEEARIFVLRKVGSDVAIETVRLREGEAKEFAHSRGDITVLLSQGVGRSGDFIRLAMGLRFRAQFSNGEVRVNLMQPNGAERVLKVFKPSEMSTIDVRVNVNSRSLHRAFVIHAGERISQDSIAPVTDMFRGQIPFTGDDYALTLETLPHSKGAKLMGEAHLSIVAVPGAETGRYLLLRGTISGASEGDWILDLAAASTVVSRSFLPKNATVEKALMSESSANGNRSVPMSIGGAGGSVEGLGAIILPELRFGTMTVKNEEVFVADSLPRIAGRSIAGILGVDVLRRAGGIRLEFLSPTQGTVKCAEFLSSDKSLAGLVLPISFANGHIFARGEAVHSTGAAVPLACLFDTGSPYSFAGVNLESCVTLNASKESVAKGLDGKPIVTREGVLEQLRLFKTKDVESYSKLAVKIATLPVITNMGANMPILLLGNDFILHHSTIEIDFVNSVAYLQNGERQRK